MPHTDSLQSEMSTCRQVVFLRFRARTMRVVCIMCASQRLSMRQLTSGSELQVVRRGNYRRRRNQRPSCRMLPRLAVLISELANGGMFSDWRATWCDPETLRDDASNAASRQRCYMHTLIDEPKV